MNEEKPCSNAAFVANGCQPEDAEDDVVTLSEVVAEEEPLEASARDVLGSAESNVFT